MGPLLSQNSYEVIHYPTLEGPDAFTSDLPRHSRVLCSFAAICVICLTGCSRSSAGGDNDAYFYNEKTKALFGASDKLLPPIDTDSGPATGVKAYVFTCGDPKDQKTHFIAYLEKLTPEGREAVGQATKSDKSSLALGFALDQHKADILVRRPNEEKWYPKYSPQGLALMKAGKESDGCAHPVPCLP